MLFLSNKILLATILGHRYNHKYKYFSHKYTHLQSVSVLKYSSVTSTSTKYNKSTDRWTTINKGRLFNVTNQSP